MRSADPLQVFVRNETGKTWGPLVADTISLLVETGHLPGLLQVSRDGVTFGPPETFPDLARFFPPRVEAPIAGPGAMKAGQGRPVGASRGPPSRAAPAAPQPPPRVSPAPKVEPLAPRVEGASAPPRAGGAPSSPPRPQTATADPLGNEAPQDAGSLADTSPLRLYYLLAAGNHTGLLTLQLPGRALEVHFKKGQPEYVGSSSPDDSVGGFLLQQGLATADQLSRAEAALERFGNDLVAALFGLGILNPGTAFSALAQRAMALLGQAMLAEEGAFTYEPKELPSHKAMPLGHRWAVLADVVRRTPTSELRRRLTPVMHLAMMKSGGRVSAAELRLNPQESRALGQLDGVRTLDDFLRHLPQDNEHFLRIAFLLEKLDIVTFAAEPARPAAPRPSSPEPARTSESPKVPPARSSAPPPPAPARPSAPRPAPAAPKAATPAAPPKPALDPATELAQLRELVKKLQGQTFFEILSVKQDADSAAVKASYLKLAKLYHPDTVSPDAPAELHELKATAFGLIGKAYRRLGEDQSRADYLEELKTGSGEQIDIARLFAAEETFQKGCLLVKAKKWDDAIRTLDEAISANAEEGEFYAWRGYAKFFQKADKKHGLQLALEDLKLGLKLNDRCAPAHYFMGHLFRLTGDNPGAMKSFERCLSIQPQHIDAQRELRLLKK